MLHTLKYRAMFFPISTTIGSKMMVGLAVCILAQTDIAWNGPLLLQQNIKHFNNCPLNIFSYIEANAIFATTKRESESERCTNRKKKYMNIFHDETMNESIFWNISKIAPATVRLIISWINDVKSVACICLSAIVANWMRHTLHYSGDEEETIFA